MERSPALQEVDQGGEQRNKKMSFSYRQRYLGADRKINKINEYEVFGRDTGMIPGFP
jgi:hypothetical protein